MKFRPSAFAFTVLLASLAALPPLATDMMLTALPVIGSALRASDTTAGYAISFFFAPQDDGRSGGLLQSSRAIYLVAGWGAINANKLQTRAKRSSWQLDTSQRNSIG